MRTIKFSEEEISSLRKVYLEKLAQTEKDIQRIKDVLKKLEVSIPKETLEEEPVVNKRGRKPKVKDIEPKPPKKRGRKPKTVVVEPKVPKKRGRKPKTVVPNFESVPETVVKEPKKRGRNSNPKVVEPTVPKKRGRPAKVAVVSTSEVSPVVAEEPKKEAGSPKFPMFPHLKLHP